MAETTQLPADGFIRFDKEYTAGSGANLMSSQKYQKTKMLPLAEFKVGLISADKVEKADVDMKSLRRVKDAAANKPTLFDKPKVEANRKKENFQPADKDMKYEQTLASAMVQCLNELHLLGSNFNKDSFNLDYDRKEENRLKFAQLALANELREAEIPEDEENKDPEEGETTPAGLAVAFWKQFNDQTEIRSEYYAIFLAKLLCIDLGKPKGDYNDLMKFTEDTIRATMDKNGWGKGLFIRQLIMGVFKDVSAQFSGSDAGDIGVLISGKARAAIKKLLSGTGKDQDKNAVLNLKVQISTSKLADLPDSHLGLTFSRAQLPETQAESVGIMDIDFFALASNSSKSFYFGLSDGHRVEYLNQSILTSMSIPDQSNSSWRDDPAFECPKEIDLVKDLIEESKGSLGHFNMNQWVRTTINQDTGMIEWEAMEQFYKKTAAQDGPKVLQKSSDSLQIRYIETDSDDIVNSFKVPVTSSSVNALTTGHPDAILEMVFLEDESCTIQGFLEGLNSLLETKKIGDPVTYSDFYFQRLTPESSSKSAEYLKRWTVAEFIKENKGKSASTTPLKEMLAKVGYNPAHNAKKQIPFICCFNRFDGKGKSGTKKVIMIRENRKHKKHPARATMTDFMNYFFKKLETVKFDNWKQEIELASGDSSASNRYFLGGFPIKFWMPKCLFVNVSSLAQNLIDAFSSAGSDLELNYIGDLHKKEEGKTAFGHKYNLSGIIFKSRCSVGKKIQKGFYDLTKEDKDRQSDYYAAVRLDRNSSQFRFFFGTKEETILSADQLDMANAAYFFYTANKLTD